MIFFKYFNNNEICNIFNYSPSGKYFLGITCKAIDNFKIKEFPSLYFYNRELNYTFELDYNDLFKKIGDNYFFLIIFDQMIINIWKIGKPFLKKYQMTFDIDSKTINFYNLLIKPTSPISIQNNSNSNNKILLIILISIGGIIIICGLLFFAYYLGKKLNSQRKKRANELGDDDFEYISKNENNNNDNEPKSLFKE